MKKIILALFFSTLLIMARAQDKIVYDANAEQRTVTAFHAISVSQGIELMIQQGQTEALAISAETKEYRDAVKTEVVNGELKIYIEQKLQKWWQQLKKNGVKVKAYVSFKTLDRLHGSSGSRTTIEGSVTGASLSVDLSSGASLRGAIKTTSLDVDQSSGASSALTGQVEQLTVQTSSGAHFYGYDLTTNTGKADASSGGKIEISVGKEIAARASSGGAISYKGEGGLRDVSTSSGGKVRRG
ncbi:MAG TPA: head GIN domain-containing protein [Flavisolibacter sp.]|jgi:hypothetical protein|nr:head GIN domain-containing protein [Flavisolibacter sp.]